MTINRARPVVAGKILLGLLALCVAVLGWTGSASANEEPCPTFAGIQKPCKFELKPPDYATYKPNADAARARKPMPTSYWIDTDGVNPGVAGCHIGVKGPNDRTANGRFFGEYCNAAGLLVESNPAKDKIHDHKGDLGHPYLVNCDAWCIGVMKKAGGQCRPNAPAPSPCNTAARCECR